MTHQAAIHVAAIRKAYGETVAVDDVSFEVEPGEIFGLIGPNGAGKTTTMECIEGLRAPDRGTISVLGLNPTKDAYALQERIGVQLQEAQLQKRIKVREAAGLWASLYQKPMNGDRLIEQLGLSEKRNVWSRQCVSHCVNKSASPSAAGFLCRFDSFVPVPVAR